MQARYGAVVVLALIGAPIGQASAGALPDIKAGRGNTVPECVTPGRLLAFLKSRNPELNQRFELLPGEYMRLGEQLGVRWDFAFYQMVLETGGLTFKNGSRTADVKPTQNNLAGLGATGKGEPGESFPDLQTGVRAHMEHLLLYSGQRLDSPVAERTRKVQEWGVLSTWQAGFTRPINFSDLAQKWAPGSNAYSRTLETLAQNFQEFCRRPDPKPELLAAVRRSLAAAPEEPPAEKPGAVLARRALEDGRVEDNNRRSGLGAIEPVSPSVTASLNSKTPPTPFKVLNAPPAAEPEAEAPPAQPAALSPAARDAGPVFRSGMLNMPVRTQPAPPAAAQAEVIPSRAPPGPPPLAPLPPQAQPPAAPPAATATLPGAAPAPSAQPPAAQAPSAQARTATPVAPRKDQPVRVAAAATAARPIADAVPPGQKCRVWTASYGGQKALIIRSIIDKVVNFTVLDVNDGAEKREADAFIAAYAKNGAVTGEYASQTTALDKAFELCPEG